jgi:hypothetical protein
VEKSGLWQTHVTAHVIEYFQSRAECPGTVNSYLKSARSLLLKSEQLTLSEDHADGPLATAAAYHGLEHFLYGCLLQMEPDEPIYADTKGATNGFNALLEYSNGRCRSADNSKPTRAYPTDSNFST